MTTISTRAHGGAGARTVPATKPAARPDAKPGGKPGAKPAPKPGGRPATSPGARPATRPATRPASQPVNGAAAAGIRAAARVGGPLVSKVRSAFATGSGAPRAPFVLLVLLLAGGGLIALLVLNTAIASASFTVQALRDQLDELTIKEQSLQQDVTAAEAPGALAAAAQQLGMMPSEHPGYLLLKPDGSYEFVGEPAPAGSPAPDESSESSESPESPDSPGDDGE